MLSFGYRVRQVGLLVLCLFGRGGISVAQDTFHIRAHVYEPLSPKESSVELHANYVGIGTRSYSGSVAPTNNQLHMAYEWRTGVTRHFSLGGMLLSGKRVGHGLEVAGMKILPHLYAPRSRHLPVDIGVVSELSYIRSAYDDDTWSLEIHPVVERRAGKWTFDVNPGFEKVLKGTEQTGWAFQSAWRIRYEISGSFTPSMEFFSESKEFRHVLIGGDIQLGPRLTWSTGVGYGPTPGGNRLIYTSVLGFELGSGDAGP